MGVLFQWLGVTPASNPFVPMQSYVFFMFYIDEINPQCKGDLSCGKPSPSTIFIRRVQSYSCEWLKHTSENGGTPPTVALVLTSIVFGGLPPHTMNHIPSKNHPQHDAGPMTLPCDAFWHRVRALWWPSDIKNARWVRSICHLRHVVCSKPPSCCLGYMKDDGRTSCRNHLSNAC